MAQGSRECWTKNNIWQVTDFVRKDYLAPSCLLTEAYGGLQTYRPVQWTGLYLLAK